MTSRVAAARTLAVSIVGHLDLEAGQTGIPVELTVVPVGLPVAATHWPLVGLTALKREEEKSMTMRLKPGGGFLHRSPFFSLHIPTSAFVPAEPTLTSIHRQLGSPFSFTAHSLPAPQNTLAHTLLLLCCSWKKGDALLALRFALGLSRFHTHGGAAT